MTYTFIPQGVCSRQIDFDVDENGIVTNVLFTGGCNGNLKGIAALVEGMNYQDVISKLENITCGHKSTSCPAQFAKALKENV